MDHGPIGSGERGYSISGVVGISGVDGCRYAVIVDYAAAPTAGLVDASRARREGHRVLLPMKQVGRADVAPMHGAEDRSDRVVLKEDVIATVNPAKTVRVVQPALWWPNVQSREAGVSHVAKRYSTHR